MKFWSLFVTLFFTWSQVTLGQTVEFNGEDIPMPRLEGEDREFVEQELGVNLSELDYVSDRMTKEERERQEHSVREAIQRLDTFAVRTDQSIDKMVRVASWALKRKGYRAEAEQLEQEYQTFYVTAVYDFYLDVRRTDLGDHAPLSQWLADWYEKLEAKLGPQLMRYLKLEHIKIINYAVPVVFAPNGRNGDSWDKFEYKRHFAGTRTSFFYPLSEHDGLAGVVSYWVVWGVCVGATFGAGVMFICSPIGEVSNYAIGKYVAPPVSDFVYCRATDNGPGCDDDVRQVPVGN